MNVNALVATRTAFEKAYGLTPNAARIRYVYAAASMVAECHGVSITENNAAVGSNGVMRSWITVPCYICGASVTNGGWQFEHINDDGHGLAGDALAEAIVKGSEDCAKVNFGCGTCNAAKNAERAWNLRREKSR